MTERPLSRQMSCMACGCEDHIVFPCDTPGCDCPPHLPTGVYPD